MKFKDVRNIMARGRGGKRVCKKKRMGIVSICWIFGVVF